MARDRILRYRICSQVIDGKPAVGFALLSAGDGTFAEFRYAGSAEQVERFAADLLREVTVARLAALTEAHAGARIKGGLNG